MTLLIGGVDKTSLLAARALRVTLRGEGDVSCGFTLLTSSSYLPRFGQPVQVLDGVTVVFGGFITSVRVSKMRNTSDLECSVSCEGYNSLPARYQITQDYEGYTAGQIVEALRVLHLASDGVTAGTISAGVTVPTFSAVRTTLAAVLDNLATASGYVWYIDKDKALHFVAAGTYTDSAISLVEGTFTDYADVSVDESMGEYRNRVTVRGASTESGQVTATAEATAEIAARAAIEGGSGVYDFVIENSEVATEAAALAVAQLDLLNHAFAPAAISFSSYTTTWQPGTRLKVNIPSLGIASDIYCLIDEVTLTREDAGILRASVKATKKGGATFSNLKSQTGKEYFTELVKQALSGGTIVANTVITNNLVTNVLTAQKGYIADLTVDRLDTSDMVYRYNLQPGDPDYALRKAPVKYMRINDEVRERVVATYAGDLEGGVENRIQCVNRAGDPLYYLDATKTGITEDETDWPVWRFVYDGPDGLGLVKEREYFEFDGTNYVPAKRHGLGNGVGDNGTMTEAKWADGYRKKYIATGGGTLPAGTEVSFGLTDNGVEISGDINQGFHTIANITEVVADTIETVVCTKEIVFPYWSKVLVNFACKLLAQEVPEIDSYTKLLLHLDGTNGSTTFTDTATSKTVTKYGNAQISTSQSVFGGAAAVFDGNGDYLSIPDSEDWNFGSADFTIDFRIRLNAKVAYAPIISQRIDSNSSHAFTFLFGSAGDKLILTYTTNGTTEVNTTFNTTFSINTWYHIALVRNGSTITCYINGVAESTTVNIGSNIIHDSTDALRIASMNGTTVYLNGWLDELRLSKGIARWTANFTPPSTEYGAALSPSQITAKTYINGVAQTFQPKQYIPAVDERYALSYHDAKDAISAGAKTIEVKMQTDQGAGAVAVGQGVLTVQVFPGQMPAQPELLSADTNTAGTIIILSFDKAMTSPVGKHAQFSATVNGTSRGITDAALNTDTTKIDLTLASAVTSGDVVTVAYTAGDVTSSDESPLASFSGQSVINNESSGYQQWTAYPQSPVGTNLFPYQWIVSDHLLVSEEPWWYWYYNSGYSQDIYTSNGYMKSYQLVSGDWVFNADISSWGANVSDIHELNNDVYTNSTLTVVKYAKTTP